MAIASKSAETPVAGKASCAAEMRRDGERGRPSLVERSRNEMSILGVLVGRKPGEKFEDPRYTAEEIREAARISARRLLETCESNERLGERRGNADALRQKAELLMKTYGLGADEVARSSSLPPQPKRE